MYAYGVCTTMTKRSLVKVYAGEGELEELEWGIIDKDTLFLKLFDFEDTCDFGDLGEFSLFGVYCDLFLPVWKCEVLSPFF